jgi:hypothetical protein
MDARIALISIPAQDSETWRRGQTLKKSPLIGVGYRIVVRNTPVKT